MNIYIPRKIQLGHRIKHNSIAHVCFGALHDTTTLAAPRRRAPAARDHGPPQHQPKQKHQFASQKYLHRHVLQEQSDGSGTSRNRHRPRERIYVASGLLLGAITMTSGLLMITSRGGDMPCKGLRGPFETSSLHILRMSQPQSRSLELTRLSRPMYSPFHCLTVTTAPWPGEMGALNIRCFDMICHQLWRRIVIVNHIRDGEGCLGRHR